MGTNRVSRRVFLSLGIEATAAALLAACGATPVPPTATKPPAVAPGNTPAAAATATKPPAAAAPTTAPAAPAAGKYKEAPILADLVKAGKLPPVDQRLPKQPKVVPPAEKIGVYGGKWRTALLGKSDTAWMSRTMGCDGMLRWTPDLQGLAANVCLKWDASADGKEFTFYLRDGMKWSDGEPHTADDFVFWYQDVVLNDELTPVKPGWMKPGGKLGVIEKVDQYTVKMKFEVPNGLLLKNIGGIFFWVQAKYAKQFHIKYNKEAVDKLVADAKLQSWTALYLSKVDWTNEPAYPTPNAWVVTAGVGNATTVVAKRNPYYYKVDPDGQQLPYIDELNYPIYDKQDLIVLKTLAGEIDMYDRGITVPANKPVLSDGKAKGGYDFFSEQSTFEGPTQIALNLNHKDPGMREVLLKKDFRVALSLAINRKDIIDTIYTGDGEPCQCAPIKESPHYHEKLATQYTQYDPKKANEMLDALGLKKGTDGFRLRLDGKPLLINIEVSSGNEPYPDTMGMVATYWKAVGVNTVVKNEERALMTQRWASSDIDATCWNGNDGLVAVIDPTWYLPTTNGHWAVAWANWWATNGKAGEEPAAPAKTQLQLYDQLKATPDDAGQKAVMKQILDIAADEFWCIGVTRYYHGYGILKNNFKNVPKSMWAWHICNSPSQTNPEQYYIQS